MKKVKEYIPYIIILILVIIIKSFVISTVCVNGNSMYPTLKNNDIMVLNKIKYKFSKVKRFDIVVIKYDNHYIIKRVIALPGEKIEYKNNILYIDGKKTRDKYNTSTEEDFSITLNDDEYFVMGDNREDSLDSRIIGAINEKDILGHSSLTIFPFTRLGNK